MTGGLCGLFTAYFYYFPPVSWFKHESVPLSRYIYTLDRGKLVGARELTDGWFVTLWSFRDGQDRVTAGSHSRYS